MSNPECAGRAPVEVKLEPGQHYWCACGKSKRQPFCDGSHAGTGISPLPFTCEAAESKWLCLCKRTGKPPFCDGSHKALPKAEG